MEEDTFVCTEQISRSRALKRSGATVDAQPMCDQLARLCTTQDLDGSLYGFFVALHEADPAFGDLMPIDVALGLCETRLSTDRGEVVGAAAFVGGVAGLLALQANVNIADPLHLTTSGAGHVALMEQAAKAAGRGYWTHGYRTSMRFHMDADAQAEVDAYEKAHDVDAGDQIAPLFVGAALAGLAAAGVQEYKVRFSDEHQLFAATALLCFHALCARRGLELPGFADIIRTLDEYLRCDGPARQHAASFRQLFGAIDRRESARVPVRLPHEVQALLSHEAPYAWYVLAAPLPVRYDKGEGVLEVAWDAEAAADAEATTPWRPWR